MTNKTTGSQPDMKAEHIYIHIPFCNGKCVYCALYSERYSGELADKYLACLEKEFDKTFNDKASPATIYFGGGTPTILNTQQIEKLINIVKDRICTDKLEELSFEAAPKTLSADKIELFTSSGVNRISVGAQSFNDEVLKNSGRRHSPSDIHAAVQSLLSAGFKNIGIDLIAGLPGVTQEIWRDTLKKTIELDIKHVSVYALTIEKNSRINVLIGKGILREPDDRLLLNALDTAETILNNAGFERYEISNYAKPGFRCLHNVSCWKGEDYLGFGPSASSRSGLKRWTNKAELKDYIAALGRGLLPSREEEILSPRVDATERIMFNLRLKEGINLKNLPHMGSERHVSPAVAGLSGHLPATAGDVEYWEKVLRELEQKGITAKTEDCWKLTKKGRNLADMAAEAFIQD